MNKNLYGLIMAGGVGSRFWPESRESNPKQFLDILGTGKSLIRMSFERLLPMIPAANIRILTHEKYADLVLQQIPEIRPSQLILEPSRNNTAPCIAYAALKIHKADPDSTLIITPADHIILNETLFRENLAKAVAFAQQENALLTLGITPTRPDTGYGYIRFDSNSKDGVHRVLQFTEKPDKETAARFVTSGEYLWNAGIFIWRSADILNAFHTLAADVLDPLAQGEELINTPAEKEFIDRAYPTTTSISIDYAIMEKADNVYTIPSDISWSDLGTWTSVYEEREKDDRGNVTDGKMLLPDTRNSLIRLPEGKLGVIRGLEDFIIVDNGDVLLIWPKSEEQDIKGIRNDIDPSFL